MKKSITFLLAAMLCAGASHSQIIRTESHSITVTENKKPKVDHGHNFLVKAGAGFMSCDGENSLKYSAIFGYQKTFTGFGLYWGAQLGVNSVMYSAGDWFHFCMDSAPAISVGPTFGIKRSITSDLTFDSHIGAEYAYALGGDIESDDKNRAIWEVGAGVWYKKVLFELEYQGSCGYRTDNGVLFNVGYKF